VGGAAGEAAEVRAGGGGGGGAQEAAGGVSVVGLSFIERSTQCMPSDAQATR
jgi:hypothetical protein